MEQEGIQCTVLSRPAPQLQNRVRYQVWTWFRYDSQLLYYIKKWILNWHSVWHLGKKLSMEQFLRKLPETVVKEGKVISIRDSIKTHLLVSVVMFQSVPFRVFQSHFPLNWIFILLRAFLMVPKVTRWLLWKHLPCRPWENGIKNLIILKLWPNRRALIDSIKAD